MRGVRCQMSGEREESFRCQVSGVRQSAIANPSVGHWCLVIGHFHEVSRSPFFLLLIATDRTQMKHRGGWEPPIGLLFLRLIRDLIRVQSVAKISRNSHLASRPTDNRKLLFADTRHLVQMTNDQAPMTNEIRNSKLEGRDFLPLRTLFPET